MEYPEGVKPDVMNYDDIRRMIPALDGHKKFVDWALHFLSVDKVNAVHRRWAYDTGVAFATHLVNDEFKFKLRVDNENVLASLKEGPFITVSNHPYGAIDGIILLHLVGQYRSDYKVMVNMILNNITAMRPAFIAVDALASDDPEKKAVSMHGIREAIRLVREGHPLGFFPAGAVSKFNRKLQVRDREWQPTIIRLIQQLKVKVVPIYFHGHNSAYFNTLGLIDWRLRSLRLPGEVFRMRGKEVHISVGDPILPEEYAGIKDLGELGKFFYDKTYALDKIK